VSEGMICSERELELSDEHAGILVLDDSAELGTPLPEVLPTGDTILEIALTTNRGDCSSLLGVAREVRAHFGGELQIPDTTPPEGARAASEDIRVEIEDGAGCPQYVARVVRGVRMGESPEWLQKKLEASGLRAINVVVDVTNLVMLEFGQPLHGFDLARLGGGVVTVRAAREGEAIQTLDGQARELTTSDLVIAGEGEAIAIAGVMGGAGSEVSDATVDVLLESAQFDPRRVRRTARRLGISTDASYRFERGVDREGVQRAADRAARLLAELAGGEVSQGVVSAQGDPLPPLAEIPLSADEVNGLLGTQLDLATIRETLARLGIEARAQGAGLLCTAPSHRNDIAIREDLVEEVARVHGFDRIAATGMVAALGAVSAAPNWRISDEVRDALVSNGLMEVMTFPFIDPEDLGRLSLESDDPRRNTVGILNPVVDSESRLRSTLVPSLLRLVRENWNRQVEQVGLFEVARVFRRGSSGELPDETLWATVVLTRGREGGLWAGESPPLFFEAKGIAERTLQALRCEVGFAGGPVAPYLHPGASAQITSGGRSIGYVGEIHPDTAAAFEVAAPCAVIELDLTAILDLSRERPRYQEVSRHPQVRRDLAVLLDRAQPAGEVLEAIRKQAGAQLVSAGVFDRYEGEGVQEGKVSVAFRLVFQRPDRTLTDSEVSKATDRVVKMLAHRFGGELR
jgi:phenylalanyl-tRNA synthetase beta chain